MQNLAVVVIVHQAHDKSDLACLDSIFVVTAIHESVHFCSVWVQSHILRFKVLRLFDVRQSVIQSMKVLCRCVLNFQMTQLCHFIRNVG